MFTQRSPHPPQWFKISKTFTFPAESEYDQSIENKEESGQGNPDLITSSWDGTRE